MTHDKMPKVGSSGAHSRTGERTRHGTTTPPVQQAQFGSNLRISVCSTQGGRKYMEDRVDLRCARRADGSLAHTFIGVYDGHGGSSAADYTRDNLYTNLCAQPTFESDDDEQVLAAMRQAFLTTHNDMLKVVDTWPKTTSGYRSTAGTTASVALIRNGRLYTGHVGDSAIVLAHSTPASTSNHITGTMITVEHKPDSAKEHDRIVADGGEVLNKAGVMRVVWARTIRGHEGMVRRSTSKERIPFLAVARSLGDLWSYNEETEAFIVSPMPDVDVHVLDETHKGIVLASDGLWNMMRPQNSVDIVNAHEWRDFAHHHGVDFKQRDITQGEHENHARWLVRHALRLWSYMRADNITAVVVLFDSTNHVLCNTVESHINDNDIVSSLSRAPSAMLRVTPDNTQLLFTTPVELVYNGAVDQPFGIGPPIRVNARVIQEFRRLHDMGTFTGPGFDIYTTDYQALENTFAARQAELTPRTIVQHARCASMTTTPPNNRKRSYWMSMTGIDDEPASVESVVVPKCALQHATATGYFCAQHGLLCDKVKQMNSQRVDAPRVSPAREQQPVGTTPHSSSKPKYFCRKHGLACEKVKKLNEMHEKQKSGTQHDGQRSHGGAAELATGGDTATFSLGSDEEGCASTTVADHTRSHDSTLSDTSMSSTHPRRLIKLRRWHSQQQSATKNVVRAVNEHGQSAAGVSKRGSVSSLVPPKRARLLPNWLTSLFAGGGNNTGGESSSNA